MKANRSVADMVIEFFAPVAWDYERGSLGVDWSLNFKSVRRRAITSALACLLCIGIGLAIITLPLGLPFVQAVLAGTCVILASLAFVSAQIGFRVAVAKDR